MFVLSVVGIVEIISYIAYHLLSVNEEKSLLLITPVNKDNYEMIIRSAIQKARWMGTLRPEKIIVVTENADEKTLSDISDIIYGYNFIKIMDKKDIPDIANLL